MTVAIHFGGSMEIFSIPVLHSLSPLLLVLEFYPLF
jgi:hypothetical protein